MIEQIPFNQIPQILRKESHLAVLANGDLLYQGKRVIGMEITPTPWIRLYTHPGGNENFVQPDTFIYVLLGDRSLPQEEVFRIQAGYTLVRSFVSDLVEAFFLPPSQKQELDLPPLATTVTYLEGTEDFVGEMERAKRTRLALHPPRKGTDQIAAWLVSRQLLLNISSAFERAQLDAVIPRILGSDAFLETLKRIRNALAKHPYLAVLPERAPRWSVQVDGPCHTT